MDSTTVIILLLIVVLIMHLVEEVKTGFRQRFLLGEMPRPLFVGGNVVLYVFCFATLVLSARGDALAIPFAWIFAVTMFLNGLGHIGIMAVRRQYFPGGLTAFLLLPVSGYLVIHLMGR
jgi:hypothetical protein